MAVTVRLPGVLRDAVGGEARIEASGATLADVFADIDRRHPGFRSRVLDDRGTIRSYVNVYVGDTDARDSGGLGTAVPEGSEVMVIPAMAGG
ncbi:MAG TPA: MoaD/ThiS family protein [Candidatus Saccharimonadales bacterium]|jgi:molybdopterin synthase sulfur carrier subunit|nr:MoaD/ThiS family protein [Candidatus Saccharimonadales bacterium]